MNELYSLSFLSRRMLILIHLLKGANKLSGKTYLSETFTTFTTFLVENYLLKQQISENQLFNIWICPKSTFQIFFSFFHIKVSEVVQNVQ